MIYNNEISKKKILINFIGCNYYSKLILLILFLHYQLNY